MMRLLWVKEEEHLWAEKCIRMLILHVSLVTKWAEFCRTEEQEGIDIIKVMRSELHTWEVNSTVYIA